MHSLGIFRLKMKSGTLFSLDTNKSPDLEGIPDDILKHHWMSVKNELIVVVLWFFKKRRMVHSLNHTFVTLIPKKVASSSLPDYMPISCVSTPFKIIAKIFCKPIIFDTTGSNFTQPNNISKREVHK